MNPEALPSWSSTAGQAGGLIGVLLVAWFITLLLAKREARRRLEAQRRAGHVARPIRPPNWLTPTLSQDSNIYHLPNRRKDRHEHPSNDPQP